MHRERWTNLHLLLAKRNFADNLQTRGLVRLRVDQILGLENVFVFLTMEQGQRLGCGVGGVMGAAEVLPCVHVARATASNAQHERWDGMTWRKQNVRSASAFLTSERLVVDIWRHLVRDGFRRMYKKCKVRRGCGWTGASTNGITRLGVATRATFRTAAVAMNEQEANVSRINWHWISREVIEIDLVAGNVGRDGRARCAGSRRVGMLAQRMTDASQIHLTLVLCCKAVAPLSLRHTS